MAEHGGYRRPANPAPVSGPGALSQRTDGGVPKMDVTGQSYGENGAINDIQSGAPMGSPSSGPRPSAAPPPQMPTPLNAPTAMPDQPVTAGADAGAGPTAADIGITRDRGQELRNTLGQFTPVLARMADSATATPTFRRQVRQYLASINT